MLAQRRRNGFLPHITSRKFRAWPGLAYLAKTRVLILADQLVGLNLFVLQYFRPAQHRRAGHIIGIKPLKPVRTCTGLEHVAHTINPLFGIGYSAHRGTKSLVIQPMRLFQRSTHALPFRIRDCATSDIAVFRLKYQVLGKLSAANVLLSTNHGETAQGLRPKERDGRINHRDFDMLSFT